MRKHRLIAGNQESNNKELNSNIELEKYRLEN